MGQHRPYRVWFFRASIKGTDTLESFLSKVAFESNLRNKLAGIEHVLVVKVYFESRKIAKVFMTHVQDFDFFRKSLSKATFERKLSGVSLPLEASNRNQSNRGRDMAIFRFLKMAAATILDFYSAPQCSHC